MRDIKFRAWDKWNDCFEEHTHRVSVKLDGNIYNSEYGDDQNDRYIIEQYTGLKDRGGNEIWEGDILESVVDDILLKWAVTKNDFAFCIVNLPYDSRKHIVDSKLFFCDRKIIGNIHEDRDLLKG